MKYLVKFHVKIKGNPKVVEVKVNASTYYLAIVRATLKYKRMFPTGDELFKALRVQVFFRDGEGWVLFSPHLV